MPKTITVQELAKRIVQQEETFILDVRNTDEFEEWKIEGENIEIVNEPYFNLMDSVEPVSAHIEKDQEIVVACAKGRSSQMVADLLEDTVFTDVYSLEGGMKAWSEHLEPVKIGDLREGGTLYQFVRLGKGCLSYFIESNGEAAVVDAARMTGFYEKFAEELGVKINYVIDTHLHADHISGGRSLAEQVGATYHLPPKDAMEVTFDYTPVEEGSDITVGNTTVDVQPIYSPGHTIGSTSFIVDEMYLLSGDILFVKSIGRPDLAGLAEEWVDDLRNTLYDRYRNLSKDLIVLPAHYSSVEEMGDGAKVAARLGDLYRENSGLQIKDKKEFKNMVTENLPPQPNAHETIRKTNMGKINPDQEKQKEMEAGPNRCAVAG
ncbi:MBL fold metallo-hydrolase [Virgibacillus ainsalahensis]